MFLDFYGKVFRSWLYFYLLDVVRNEENQVSGRCRAEMNGHRKMLMDDYNISPEVVSKCAKDIQVRT